MQKYVPNAAVTAHTAQKISRLREVERLFDVYSVRSFKAKVAC
jgi:hypothetical protein